MSGNGTLCQRTNQPFGEQEPCVIKHLEQNCGDAVKPCPRCSAAFEDKYHLITNGVICDVRQGVPVLPIGSHSAVCGH